MCGDFCAMKKGMEVFQEDIAGDKIAAGIQAA
jgi:phosphomethylpyrimidine synthase